MSWWLNSDVRRLRPRVVCLVLCACLSVWAARKVPRTVPRAAPRAAVVVVRAEAACPGTDRAYAAALAERAQGWLREGGVKADLAGDRALDKTLAGRRLAFCVAFSQPTPGQLAALSAFRARGGRLVVLQSHAPALKAASHDLFSAPCPDKEKARQLLALANKALPGVWNPVVWASAERSSRADEEAYGRRQQPRAGEIHAVWDHAGTGLYPGDWPRTIRLLRQNRVTDLFVNVGGAGFAHYASGVLPRSKIHATYGDQLARCLAAAQGSGIRVHAWFLCFSAARGAPARLQTLAKRGWRVRNTRGTLTEYLDPANADLRWHILQALDEIVRNYPVDGLHLDFVRWYEGSRVPRNAAATITSFVTAVRQRQRAARPQAWLTAAVLGYYPGCTRSVGQDWGAWLDARLVDYAVPMNYEGDLARFTALVQTQGAVRSRAARTIAGLGVTARESTLSARQTIDQINAVRRAGLAGVAFFDLDPTLTETIFPILRLGMMK